jgi:hypothetical protein
VLFFADGSETGSPDGVMNEDVSMKKINNRKIRSVMEAMLKLGSILFFEFNFISFSLARFLQQINEIDGCVLHFMDHFLNPGDQVVVCEVCNDSHEQSCYGGYHCCVNSRGQ